MSVWSTATCGTLLPIPAREASAGTRSCLFCQGCCGSRTLILTDCCDQSWCERLQHLAGDVNSPRLRGVEAHTVCRAAGSSRHIAHHCSRQLAGWSCLVVPGHPDCVTGHASLSTHHMVSVGADATPTSCFCDPRGSLSRPSGCYSW